MNYILISNEEEYIAEDIVDSAYAVHSNPGTGLLGDIKVRM